MRLESSFVCPSTKKATSFLCLMKIRTGMIELTRPTANIRIDRVHRCFAIVSMRFMVDVQAIEL